MVITTKIIKRIAAIFVDQSGMAMMLSMCILFVCTALSLAILLSSGARMTEVRQEAYAQQAYITSSSVADAVDLALKTPAAAQSGQLGSLNDYLKRNFPTWYAYTGGNSRIAVFDLDFFFGENDETALVTDSAGQVKLKLYRSGTGYILGQENQRPQDDSLVVIIETDYHGKRYVITRNYVMDTGTQEYGSDWDGKWKKEFE